MITKKYLLEQIERVENIILKGKSEIKIIDYCIAEEIKDLKTLKNNNNYKEYKKEITKFDISNIQCKYFKNSCLYKNFKKEILLNYLEDIIDKAYGLKLLDNNFTY